MRKLDRSWWTSFSFFIAAVAISTGTVLYRAKIDEQRYSDLFKLYVTRSVPTPPAGKAAPKTPSKTDLAI
ncbi:hypothetical protein ACVIGB_000488 [Bradyrhizobium sp. USDA 4341]